MDNWLQGYRPIGRNDLRTTGAIDIGSHWRHVALGVAVTITAISKTFATGFDGKQNINRPVSEFTGPRPEWTTS